MMTALEERLASLALYVEALKNYDDVKDMSILEGLMKNVLHPDIVHELTKRQMWYYSVFEKKGTMPEVLDYLIQLSKGEVKKQ